MGDAVGDGAVLGRGDPRPVLDRARHHVLGVDEQGELDEPDRDQEQQREGERGLDQRLAALAGTPASAGRATESRHGRTHPIPEMRPRMFWNTLGDAAAEGLDGDHGHRRRSGPRRMAYSTIDWPGCAATSSIDRGGRVRRSGRVEPGARAYAVII